MKGESAGDVCNRDGCKGIISEHEREGSCSCHTNPPCGTCTEDRRYCPECDWQGEDDYVPYTVTPSEQEYHQKQFEDRIAREELFNSIFRERPRTTIVEEVMVQTQSHTHFSMKHRVIFNPGETPPTEKVAGTFGGRWEYLDKKRGVGIYISYTD